MTSGNSGLRTQINEIIEQIGLLEDRIILLQNRCSHPNATIEWCSNTGNYDPTADKTWQLHECPDCDKVWRIINDEC